MIGRSALRDRETGVYEINDAMVADIKKGKMRVEHAAVLGALIARMWPT